MAERGIGDDLVENRIVDAVELEREEQQLHRCRGQPLLHVAVKLGAGRIERVAGVNKAGEGGQPAHAIVDGFVAAHRGGQRRAATGSGSIAGELALIGLLEGGAFGIGAIEIALDRRIVKSAIEIVQIPFRQMTGARCIGSRGLSGRGFVPNLAHAWL